MEQASSQQAATGGATGGSAFVCYRRADAAGWAGRLHADLDEALGPGHIFRDVALEPGTPVREHIDTVLDGCDILLAVIGPQWTTLVSANGRRRLDEPGDLVRREIARGLKRRDVEVIPILVGGAKMPTEDDLPVELAALCDRHACEITDPRWDYDLGHLAGHLRKRLGLARRVVVPPPPPVIPTTPALTAAALTAGATLGGLVAGAATAGLRQRFYDALPDQGLPLGDRLEPAGERAAYLAGEYAIVFGVALGCAVLAALALRGYAEGRRLEAAPVIRGVVAGLLAGALAAVTFVVVKDVTVLGGPDRSNHEARMEGASLAVAGLVMGAAVARLRPGVSRAAGATAGALGGLFAGLLNPGVFDASPMGGKLAVSLAFQVLCIVGPAAAVLAMPAAERSDQPAPVAATAHLSR
jgi:hypothetical protein